MATDARPISALFRELHTRYDGAVDDELLDLLVEARALQVTVWLALGSLSLSAETIRLEERLAWLRARDLDTARETGKRSADGKDE